MSCLIQSADGKLAYFGFVGTTDKKESRVPCCYSTREPELPQTHTRGSKRLQAPTKEVGKLQNGKLHAHV